MLTPFVPPFERGTNSYFYSLYQYCRIIIHSFGHKAEICDPAPLTKPSSYVATVRASTFVAPVSLPDSDYRCTVHGCLFLLVGSVVELYALNRPCATRPRLFLCWDRLRWCISP